MWRQLNIYTNAFNNRLRHGSWFTKTTRTCQFNFSLIVYVYFRRTFVVYQREVVKWWNDQCWTLFMHNMYLCLTHFKFLFVTTQIVCQPVFSVHTTSLEEPRMTAANSIRSFTEEPHCRIVRTCDPRHYILLQPISPSLIKKRCGQWTNSTKRIFQFW